jgi:hypothetical protein
MNLTEMRARVRQDLQDTDAANYRWTDDEVDGAIQRAVKDLSFHYPLQQQDDIATTNQSNEIDISSLLTLLGVYSVEFPIGCKPPYYQKFAVWPPTIYMGDEGNGDDARIRWGKLHTLDAESSTIPEQFDEIIVLGATGYLATSASAYTVDRATIAGRYATADFLKWAQARLAQYRKELRSIALNNRIVTKELYLDK